MAVMVKLFNFRLENNEHSALMKTDSCIVFAPFYGFLSARLGDKIDWANFPFKALTIKEPVSLAE